MAIGLWAWASQMEMAKAQKWRTGLLRNQWNKKAPRGENGAALGARGDFFCPKTDGDFFWKWGKFETKSLMKS
jgi:hypothetical protein